MAVNNEFSRVLKAAMLRNGWTQKQLAEHLAISRTAVNNYLQGTSTPKTNHYLPIAQLLGISVDELVEMISGPDSESTNDLQVLLTMQSALINMQQRIAALEDQLRKMGGDLP